MTLKSKLLASAPAALEEGWDLSTAQSLNIFNVGLSFGQAALSSDGTKMYVTYTRTIRQYDLTTAFDISTAVLTNTFSFGSDGSFNGLSFKSDGTIVYTIRAGSGYSQIIGFGMSTPWDISTASDTNPLTSTYNFYSTETSANDIYVSPDGTKLYTISATSDVIRQFDLSTPWNVSSMTQVYIFNLAFTENAGSGIFFKSDGTKMYVVGTLYDSIREYDLSSAWNINTASFLQSHSFGYFDSTPRGLHINSDGTKLYVTAPNNSSVVGLTFSTPWDVSSLQRLNLFNIAPQEASSLAMAFKPDGTKMYIMGASGDDVNEYNLSTPWDVTTASYAQVFYIGSQDTNPTGLFFKPDGTKMYVIGTIGDDVNEYNLSTPWDVSTASYVQVFYIGTQDTAPSDIFFKPDGTKMFILGDTGNDINEYSLGTPWDVSTASYVQVFSVSAQDATPSGIFFKPDGTKMFICGNTNDKIYEYELSTPWNISTASYLRFFLIYHMESGVGALAFRVDNGKRLYFVGVNSDDVYQIDL